MSKNGKIYRRRHGWFGLSLLLLAAANLFVGGCRSKEGAAATENTPSLSPSPQTTVTARRIIFDDLGRGVNLPARVERAVSLAPNLTEIVFAVGAGDRLVGVTSYCNYPADALKIRKIGDTINPNLETIVALEPQVVFVSTASQIEAFTKTLEGRGIAVFVTNPQDVEGVYRGISQIGEVFGTGGRASAVVNDLKRRVADVEARTASAKDVKVFVQFSKEPLFTVGKSSFVTDLVRRAGGASVTENIPEAYPKFSKESALAAQPEAIILSDSEDNREPNEVFKDSPAMRDRKVFRVNADLLSRPAPRMIDALEQIAVALHPESFR